MCSNPIVVFAAAEDAAGVARAASSEAVAVADAAAAAEGAVLITGANSGVGFSAAKQLAAQGKRVVLACRTEAKGVAAAAAIREKVPGAKLDVLPGVGLEMTDLRASSDYLKAFQDSGTPLDVLVLNAGIMAVPLGRTEQGHELHFGVNHLAHFLVQDGLMPQLRATQERTGARGRLVACSSIANTLGGLTLDLADLDWQRRGYNEWEVGLDTTFHHGILQSKHQLTAASMEHVNHLTPPGSECNPCRAYGQNTFN
jgi:hypothetical protein